MKAAAIRAVRTFIQTVLGFILTSGIIQALSEGVIDWTAIKTVGIAAVVAGVGAVLAFVQNYLEETYAVTYDKG